MGLKRIEKMILIIIIAFLIIFLVLFAKNKGTKYNYIPTVYEEELITYFKEVVLKSEYYESPERIVKWYKPMILYISKDKEYKGQIKIIQKTVDEINKLATDGFRIEVNNEVSKCNAILYLCRKERVAEIAPDFYNIFTGDSIVDEVAGFTYMSFKNSNHEMVKSLIFIDTEESFEIQATAILEELTHSIGIPNDSDKYPNSILYENKDEHNILTKEYSQMDRDIIRLLYHPKMKSGLNARQSEKVIKKIFKSADWQGRSKDNEN